MVTKLTKAQGIGLFVLMVLIATYLLINFLKGADIFNSRKTYYANFHTVEGLSETGPVYIRGLKVGTIKDITYDKAHDIFTVKISVKSDYALPENSVAEIYSSDILGAKSLRISIGDGYRHAKEGDTLKSNNIPDVMTLLSKEVGPLKKQIYGLIGNMNKAIDNINDVLSENNKKNLSSSLANMDSTLDNAKRISLELKEASPYFGEMIANLNELSANLRNSGKDISEAAKNANKFTEGLTEADVKGTIESLKKLIEKIQDPKGSVGKLLTNDELHDSIDSLTNSLNILVNKISENPKKYIRIKVF